MNQADAPWYFLAFLILFSVFRVERYRPQCLDDIIAHEDIISGCTKLHLYSCL